jgi:hypothetical protein
MHFHIVKMYKDKELKMSIIFFVNVWRKNIFDIYVTEIRIIATGPCIANQLRDVNTICRRSWYIAAHVWEIYDFKIEVVPLIINFSTELTTQFLYSYESEFLQKLVKDKKIHEARAFNFTYRYIDNVLSINNFRFAEFLPLIYPYLENLWF